MVSLFSIICLLTINILKINLPLTNGDFTFAGLPILMAFGKSPII